MKRILFVHHAAGWGGAPVSLMKLIKAIDPDQYQVKVLLIKDSIVSERFREAGIECVVARSRFYNRYYHYLTHSEADYIKWFQVYKFIKLSVYWLLSKYIYAPRELKLHDYDLVHLNSSVLTDWLAPASKYGRVLIHIREPFRRGKLDVLAPLFRSQMSKYADHIIAISKDNSKRIGLEKISTVVYNYSEVETLDPLPQESYSGQSVLYVGGHSRIKGFYTLVEALPLLTPGVKVLFAGYYPEQTSKNVGLKYTVKSYLRSIVYPKESKLLKNFFNDDQKVKKLGLIKNINAHLDEVVGLVSPFARPHFSRPVIESFARRKGVIVSDVSGMEEIVTHNKNGIMFRTGNAKELAAAINLLCADHAAAKRFGDEGYEIARKKYNVGNIELIANVYSRILDN